MTRRAKRETKEIPEAGSQKAGSWQPEAGSMNLTIDKMIYGGDGLARNPGGKTVFMPLVLPGEEVDATIVDEKPGYARAIAAELLKASDRRIVPSCSYFARCGGCHYQHTDY